MNFFEAITNVLVVTIWGFFFYVMTLIFINLAEGQTLLEVGASQSLYTDSQNEWSFQANMGDKRLPVYALVGYESPKIRMLGQPLADSEIYSVGLGARKCIDGFSVFTEAGYSWVEEDPDGPVQQEVVYTKLVQNHNVYGRPVPVTVDGPYDKKGYTSSYKAADGPFLRVGVGYQILDNLALRASYRFLQVDEEYTIKDIGWNPGDGYWREDQQLDLSTWEMGIWYTW